MKIAARLEKKTAKKCAEKIQKEETRDANWS
jgi:hypothetical protein